MALALSGADVERGNVSVLVFLGLARDVGQPLPHHRKSRWIGVAEWGHIPGNICLP